MLFKLALKLTLWLFLLVKNHGTSTLPPAKTGHSATSQEMGHVPVNCLKYDYQIQDVLTSTMPPFDNYFNISEAIYPSEDISSKLINVWVHFTNSSGNLTQVDQRHFIWSRSCLYVSDKYLSLRAMSVYSVGSVWPDRRQEDLHITILAFCNPQTTTKKLVQFLSTLEDIAVNPDTFNPSLNNVECVVENESSKDRFKSVKKTFPQICWAFWLFSLIGSYFVNMLCIQLFNDNYNNREDIVVKATSFFLFVVFWLGIVSAVTAICYSTEGLKLTYPIVYLLSIILVFFRGLFYCNIYLILDAKKSHITPYSLSAYTLDPGCFIVTHSILWMMVGMISEPFWAIPVVTSYAVVIFLFYLSAFFYFSADRKWDARDKVNLAVLVVLVLSVISVQFSFFTVGSHLFNEGLISSIIPSFLLVILSFWCKFFKNYDSNKLNQNQLQTKAAGEGQPLGDRGPWKSHSADEIHSLLTTAEEHTAERPQTLTSRSTTDLETVYK